MSRAGAGQQLIRRPALQPGSNTRTGLWVMLERGCEHRACRASTLDIPWILLTNCQLGFGFLAHSERRPPMHRHLVCIGCSELIMLYSNLGCRRRLRAVGRRLGNDRYHYR